MTVPVRHELCDISQRIINIYIYVCMQNIWRCEASLFHPEIIICFMFPWNVVPKRPKHASQWLASKEWQAQPGRWQWTRLQALADQSRYHTVSLPGAALPAPCIWEILAGFVGTPFSHRVYIGETTWNNHIQPPACQLRRSKPLPYCGYLSPPLGLGPSAIPSDFMVNQCFFHLIFF